jgi:hypothetical protein
MSDKVGVRDLIKSDLRFHTNADISSKFPAAYTHISVNKNILYAFMLSLFSRSSGRYRC